MPNNGDSLVKLTKLGDFDHILPHFLFNSDIVAYPGAKNSLVPFADGGFAFLELIEDASSPETFQYQVEIGADQTIVPDGSGGYNVVNKEGGFVISLGAPWAVDAKGVEIPIEYTLDDGGLLTLVVEHRSKDYTYPIVADPCWSFWSSQCRGQVISKTVESAAAATTAGVILTVAWQ